MVELALAARERTGGRVDPTILPALDAWGYDRSFDEIAAGLGPTPAPAPCGGAVEVDVTTGSVRLGRAVRLDLGGIAKGYVVDRVADLLGRSGPCLVNAGGDVAVRGTLDGRPWPVAAETTRGAVTLSLPWGSLATSGRDERRWMRGAAEAHHLIDPATGCPSDSDLLRVTAAGATTVDAEVNAKALFLVGSRAAVQEAGDARIPAVLVTRSGDTIYAGGLG